MPWSHGKFSLEVRTSCVARLAVEVVARQGGVRLRVCKATVGTPTVRFIWQVWKALLTTDWKDVFCLSFRGAFAYAGLLRK